MRIIMAMPAVILTFLLGLTSIVLITAEPWAWGLIPLVITIVFLSIFLRNIPATPPYVGVVTIWGERKEIIKKEGWKLLAPIFPFFYDVVRVKVEKRNKDFKPKDVRSKEKAELVIEVSITYTPDKQDAKNLIEYLNTGGRDGVEEILDDIVEENCREFAGGIGWEECIEMKKELAILLITEITGEDRDDLIKSLQRGNGVQKIPSLGIIINRLNIGTIKPLGELIKAAEKKAVEVREREAERVEVEFVQEATELLKGAGLSAKDAVEVVQTERGKVKKEIQEKKYEGLDKIGEGIAKALTEFFKRNS